jgi:hypothetical protein
MELREGLDRFGGIRRTQKSSPTRRGRATAYAEEAAEAKALVTKLSLSQPQYRGNQFKSKLRLV